MTALAGTLQFPAKSNVRGRPRLTLKKIAVGQRQRAAKLCIPYGSKSVRERTITMLRYVVRDFRAEDVTERNPVGPNNLVLQPCDLPSIVLHANVVLGILKPVMTPAAWKKFVAARRKLEMRKCACCHKDTGSDNCVECDSCLEWYHWPCVGMERTPRGNWYCYTCRMNC